MKRPHFEEEIYTDDFYHQQYLNIKIKNYIYSIDLKCIINYWKLSER